MSDYVNVIEQIKQSDAKIGSLTKQIKEMEAEIKKTETEADIIKAKNKQLLQDIKYKKKILDDKYNEINILQKDLNICYEMITDKKKFVEEAEKKLEEIQKEVFNSRIKFIERAKNFVDDCDYLVVKSCRIDEASREKEEEKKLLSDIQVLETDVLALEKQFLDLQKELEILETAEKNKIALETEPDNGEEFKRIRIKIDACEEELEDIEFKSNAKINFTPSPFKAHFMSEAHVSFNVPERSNVDDPSKDYFSKDYTYNNQEVDLRYSTNSKHENERVKYKQDKKNIINFTPKTPSSLPKRSPAKQQAKKKKKD